MRYFPSYLGPLFPCVLRVYRRGQAVVFAAGLTVAAGLAPMSSDAAPDAYLDVEAAIPQPPSSLVGGDLFDPLRKAKARINIYRTSVNPRNGILIRVGGFGSFGVNVEELNDEPLPPGGEDKNDNPNLKMARDDLGFDIYVLYWNDGTDYIQKNAMALAELLRKVREGGLTGEQDGATPEAPLGPDEKLVVVAESMGGLVSRYALVYLEDQGVDHQVDLWMTIDSPHAGAYIPIGIQYLVKDLNQLFGGLAAADELAEIDSLAARQMLLYHHTEADDPSTPPNHQLFDLFFDELNTVYGGYPQAPGLWRVALSNGRPDGEHALLIDNEDILLNLPKDEARLLTFELSPDSVLDQLEKLTLKVLGRTVYRTQVGLNVTLGTTIDVWSLRPHLSHGKVYERRTGLILKLAGERVNPSSHDIIDWMVDTLNIPSWISDSIVDDGLDGLAGAILDAFHGISMDPPTTRRVDADYAWDYVSGGLGERTREAADALDFYVSSVDLITSRHSYIPATSSLGLPGYPLLPLQNLTAQDTPFDAIYYEPARPGNRTHVQYNKKTGKPAFEFEMNRVLTVPSLGGFSTPRLPEGTPPTAVSASGINFTSNTVAYWNGSARATTFISENEVLISLIASDLSTPSVADITLSDPVSAYTGMSTTQFEVVDVALRVTPAFPAPGDSVDINYTGIYRDGGVPENPYATVNGTNITLEASIPSGTFVFVLSPYELDVTVGPLTGGTYQVTYQEYNGPVTKTFDVFNPPPAVTSIVPAAVTSGVADVRLRLHGDGFLRDPASPSNTLSQTYWNGQPVPATILSPNLLLVDVSPTLLGVQRTNTLRVVNPGPGGGTNEFVLPFQGPILTAATLESVSPVEESLLLRVQGPDLGEGSTVWWNGEALATERGMDGDLVALVPPGRMAEPGEGIVTVVDSNGWESARRLVTFVPPPTVRYVRLDTPAGDDGESWETAYDDLQTALAAAVAGQEIWVAEGVYVPSTNGVPTASFVLVDGVAVYGGFRGNEVVRTQRNPDPFSNQTVLSGDQWQDGSSNDDNSEHVVLCQGLSTNAVLDGFTVRDGYRTIRDIVVENRGGGIWVQSGSVILRNLHVTGNTARFGGGIALFGGGNPPGEVILTDSTVSGNFGFFGGGLQQDAGEARLTDVDFIENAAGWQGGGYQAYGLASLDRVRFLGNTGLDGGGLWQSGVLTANNALFAGNDVGRFGGAIYAQSAITLHHASFAGNRAEDAGGAIWSQGAAPILYHSILWSNTAPLGTEIHGATLDAASAYNTVQGGQPTGSNTSTNDPRFVRAPDPGDGEWRSLADNDYGNLRLRVGSPAVDAGDTSLVPAEVATDLLHQPRVQGGSVDGGAYEGAFVTFTDLYPHLEPELDANLDGVIDVLPYVQGEDPGEPFLPGSRPRLVRETDQLYLEFAVRVMAGDYWLAMDASDALPAWVPLPEDLGHALVLDEVEDRSGGIQWRRVRLLIDPSSTAPGFFHSYAFPRGP